MRRILFNKSFVKARGAYLSAESIRYYAHARRLIRREISHLRASAVEADCLVFCAVHVNDRVEHLPYPVVVVVQHTLLETWQRGGSRCREIT